MKVQVKSEINVDLAIKTKNHEFLIAIDLLKWCLYKVKKTDAGYKALHFLCFVFAVLDRDVFDKWVDDNFGQMIHYEHEDSSGQREDVM